MPPQSLREFLKILEEHNELKTVSTKVSPELEITEIIERKNRQGGPALLFNNVAGSDVPLAIDLFGSEKRICLALDVESLDSLKEDISSLIKTDFPKNWRDRLKSIPKLKRLAGMQPKIVKKAPCQEIVIKDKPSLNIFPIIKCWPQDGGKYITLPCIISKDPETARRNVGMYRMQVFDDQSTGMHWHIHKHGAAHYQKSSKMKKPLEVAVAIGAEPAVSIASGAPMPEGVDEFLLAGFLKRKPVKLVKCITVDLEAPAEAEIVLEGVVQPGKQRPEGPFGDHTGHYSQEDLFPVFQIKCITHRKNPIYQTTVTGRPPREDFYMGQALSKIFFPLLQMVLPELVDINLPAEGVFHNLAIVSMKKQYPWHARKVMHTLWGMGQLMFTKIIIVVDEGVNIHDLSEVWWHVGNNIDPHYDVTFTEGPVDVLDAAAREKYLGTKMGIDATIKTAEEGLRGDWPEIITMSQDIKDLVSKRWQEYGF